MIDSLASLDDKLRSQCAQLVAKHDEALKDELMRAVVQPNLARLRAGNGTPWNEPGWYSALHDLAPAEAAAAPGYVEEDFPVAVDCGNWYAPELDSRSGVRFRFFYREAWLDLPVPAAPCRLCFSVPHVIMPEALERMSITVCGLPVAHSVAPQRDACGSVEALFGAELVARARSSGSLRVRLSTPVAALPTLLYPNSSDRRLLSLALTFPTLSQI